MKWKRHDDATLRRLGLAVFAVLIVRQDRPLY
jgi:hypothetical protein